jgi:hypothetical protein
MKAFTPLLNTEKNKKTGAAPVWILKIPFVSGTLYLSDRIFTYTGITIKPWIANWGKIDESISDEMGAPQVSDFAVDIIIDPDEATDIHDLLWSESVETLRCELYLWFEGLTVATDPMVLMWAGNIIDFDRLNELAYNVRLVDESVRIDKHPGRVLSLADYPNADLNHVGYQMPILYGDVDGAEALGLDVGARTALIAELSGTTGLAIGTTNTAVANGLFTYSISGTNYSKAANAAGTAPGNDVIPVNHYGAVAFDIGADGTIDVIEAAGNAAGYDTAALAIAGIAAAAAGHVRMGTVTAISTSGSFTFGTTALNAANTTVVYTPVALHTDFYLSSGRSLVNGDTIIIGTEEIYIATISDTHITACTRGYNSTTAALHAAGTLVQGKKTSVVYMFADHPVHSIGNIYATGTNGVSIDITDRCTKYTGQTGSELAGYEGKAVITVPTVSTTEVYTCTDLPKTLSQTTLSATGTFATPSALGTITERYYLIYFTASVSVNPSETTSGDATGGPLTAENIHGVQATAGTMTSPASFKTPKVGTPTETIIITWSATVTSLPTGYVSFSLQVAGYVVCEWRWNSAGLLVTPGASPASIAFTLSAQMPGSFTLSGTQNNAADAHITFTVTGIHLDQAETGATSFKINVKSDDSLVTIGTVDHNGWTPAITSPHKVVETGAWHTGTIAITHGGGGTVGGTSSLKIDKVEMCQVIETAPELSEAGVPAKISGEGYQDDGSGTITGTPSALIERPDHIFDHFLYTYAVWPLADFSTDAATPFAADSYKLAVVINTRKRMKEWLAYMAFQCRCWFRFSNGKAYLLYRPDSLSSDKTITAAMIRMNDDYTTSVRGPSRSPLDEIINKVTLYYQRDWSKPEGREAYQAVVTVENAASIAAYGEKEKPDLFLFDYIRDATVAADLAAFYLARYKDRKKVISMDLFLDNAELEFADAITVTPLSALVGEVRKVNFAPGSGRDMRNDMITLTMREY